MGTLDRVLAMIALTCIVMTFGAFILRQATLPQSRAAYRPRHGATA